MRPIPALANRLANRLALARARPALLIALLATSVPLSALVSPLAAQDVHILRRPEMERRIMIGDDRPMIGLSTIDESQRADTLGLRIESAQKGSPAEKAGLKAGDRLQSINGVSLRADRADAGEEDYSGVLNRRLQREVQRTKPREAVELRVLSDGQVRTVRVTPVKASELMAEEFARFQWKSESADRAVLGLTLGGTGSVRDTLGVFVRAVAAAGPAEKAGIVEGDRIAAINGVSLRVSREDAGDEGVGASRAERLVREMAKVKAGEVAELVVVTAGRSRTLRVTTVKASELPEPESEAFFFGTPTGGSYPSPRGEMIRLRTDELSPDIRAGVRERIRMEAMPEVMERLRIRRVIRTI